MGFTLAVRPRGVLQQSKCCGKSKIAHAISVPLFPAGPTAAMIATTVHLLAHVLVPGAVALLFFRSRWRYAWLVMLATMMVDLDHLLADPVFDPERCSIGFHPLHSLPAILVYALALALPLLRLVAVGLLIHMGLDGTDCLRQAR